jgi:hypothetical protein
MKQLTEEQVKDLLDKLKNPKDALKFLQDAGLIDDSGELTPPYRPLST